jgi:hypothetical protein
MYDYGGTMINCVVTTIIFFVVLLGMEIAFQIIRRKEDPFIETPSIISIDSFQSRIDSGF